MTIALEPGLYVPGWGGMRLEGNYLITATGFERLDRFLSGPRRSGRLRPLPPSAPFRRPQVSITGSASGAMHCGITKP